MKGSAFIITVIIIMAGFSSCSSKIYLQKSYPPEIVPGKKPITIAFLNNFNYSNPEIAIAKHKETYSNAIRYFTKGMVRGFSSHDSVKIVVADTLRKLTDAGMLTTLLPIEDIELACKRYNADIVIALDSVSIAFHSQVTSGFEGQFVSVYSRRVYLNTEYFLSTYYPSGDLLNRCSVDYSTFYSWRVAVTEEMFFSPSVATAYRKVGRAAEPSGEAFTKKFRPSKENLSFEVYDGAAFKRSNELMNAWKWEEAITLLEQLSNSSRKSIAIKAAKNLEVAKEGLASSQR